MHPPVNTARPQIDGPPIPGARLTCVPGSWTGASSLAYEWLRDGAPRAAGVTYRPGSADVSHLLTCIVTAANADGSTQATSPTVRVVRTAPPLLFALRISPAVIRAARSGPSVVSTSRRGAIVSFRLDEAATVTFTVQRMASKHRFKALRGSFRVKGHRGLNRLRFTGRIRHHALRPGKYRLTLRARDASGRVGRPVRVRFAVKA
jgi:hypothetical protein